MMRAPHGASAYNYRYKTAVTGDRGAPHTTARGEQRAYGGS